MNRLLRVLAVPTAMISAAAFAGSCYAAATFTEFGFVNAMQAGWTIDRMLVFHSKPMINPGNCSLLTNGYIVDENAPGHNLFNTMILSALLNKREVAFVIDGCKEDRPVIISVSIR